MWVQKGNLFPIANHRYWNLGGKRVQVTPCKIALRIGKYFQLEVQFGRPSSQSWLRYNSMTKLEIKGNWNEKIRGS
jgi:hypothetical protein